MNDTTQVVVYTALPEGMSGRDMVKRIEVAVGNGTPLFFATTDALVAQLLRDADEAGVSPEGSTYWEITVRKVGEF